MNLSTLIARAFDGALRDHPKAIGVSLSPVGLSADELRDTVSATKRLLGDPVRVVGSAPSAELTESEGLFIAPDQRAAERATEWRNSVDVGRGEHIVYISVEEHPKASGLRDCLFSIQDSAVVQAFMEWSESADSPLPKDFANRLQEAGLWERVSIGDLCDLATAVAAEPPRVPRWQAVGRNLFKIGLVRDSKLGGDEVSRRLAGNKELVTGLLTGERRKNRVSQNERLEKDLAAAFSTNVDVRDALASVDIGGIDTDDIEPKRQPKRRTRTTKSPDRGKSRATAGKKSPKTTGEPKKRERKVKGGTSGPEQPSPPDVGEEETVTVSPPPATDQPPQPRPPDTPAAPQIRVSVEPLPRGLGVLLEELLDPATARVEAAVREAARGALQTLGRDAVVHRCSVPLAEASCQAELLAWREARSALLSQIQTVRGQQDVPRVLARGMRKLVAHDVVRPLVESLATATERLFRRAAECSDDVMREVLSLDTISLRDASGRVVLRVLGPLHLLALGQSLTQARLGDQIAKLPPALRRLSDSALRFGPTAPASLPVGAVEELSLSRSEAGLLVFELVPELVDRRSLESLGNMLVRRFVELSPSALLGVRMVVVGSVAAEMAEGAARALQEEERLERVVICCARPPSLRQRSAALAEVEAGRLRFDAVSPSGAGALLPHIVVYAPSGVPAPDAEEPAWSSPNGFASSLGGERAAFEVCGSGLRVRTSVQGVSELEAFDLVHARLRDRTPKATFTVNAAALGLGTVVDLGLGAQSTWHAVIGPNLGRRPPMGSYLLAYDAVDAGTMCAIASKNMRPAIWVVRKGLERVGIIDQRPNALRELASKLANVSGSGLISLNGDDSELLAGALLAAELRRTEASDGALVAHIHGRSREVLLGDHDANFRGVLALGLDEPAGTPRLTLGFATLDAGTDIDVSLTRLGGRLGAQLEHVVSMVTLGVRDKGIGAAVAREALAWSLWPAAASHEPGESSPWPERLKRALTAAEIEVSLLIVLPSQFAPKRRAPKVGKITPRYVVLDRPLVQRTFMADYAM